jgi:multicomponent Na+:H+ antiporter subunit G
MKEWAAALFLVSGSFFMLLAGLGTLRFPDLYSRMHAATKAASFGVGLMLTGFVIYYSSWYLLLESALIIVFVFITAPIAAHMLGRAGYLLKVSQYKDTLIDEMSNLYENEIDVKSDDPGGD